MNLWVTYFQLWLSSWSRALIPFKTCNRYSKFDSPLLALHNSTLKVLIVKNVDLCKHSYIWQHVTSVVVSSEFQCQHIFRWNFLYRFKVLREFLYTQFTLEWTNGGQERKHCCDKTVNTVDEGTYLSDNEHAEVVIVQPAVSVDRCSDSLSESSHMRTDDSESDTSLQAGMKRDQ